MTVPDLDGCPWPVDPACLTEDWETLYEEDVKARAVALAGNTLRRLTGYRVGGCPITVRPCGHEQWRYWGLDGYGVVPFRPYLDQHGSWHNAACGTCGTSNKRLRLEVPMGGVVEVKVDGAVLDEGTDYWVDGRWLVSLGAAWPITQDLDLPTTEDDTFEVTYYNSYPVDGLGAYAAGKLAMQYAQACLGKKCELPSTVTNVVRQGVTFSLPAGAFPNGETGIREVDAYIGLWNPKHRVQKPMVWSP